MKMKKLFDSEMQRYAIEIYMEYLRKIPELLKQIETVEKIGEKAEIELAMLEGHDRRLECVEGYLRRLESTLEQARQREKALREELHLIMQLKGQLEEGFPFVK